MSEKSREKAQRKVRAQEEGELASALGDLALERMKLRQHVGNVCASAAYGLSQELLANERGIAYAGLQQDAENPDSPVVGCVVVALNPTDATRLLEMVREMAGPGRTERTVDGAEKYGPESSS